MRDSKDQLISYLLTNGKTDGESWLDLALRFKIGEGLPAKKRAKKAQDLWRGYKRANRGISPATNLIVKRVKEWDGPGGERKQSIEYAAVNPINENSLKTVWEEFKKDAAKYAPKYSSVSYPKSGRKGLMEICIPDLHLGKLSWGDETGEDYDLEEAKTRYFKALKYLLEVSKDVERFVLVVGNDFFNSDTMGNTTTPSGRNSYKGTPQQDDSRWQKMFLEGRKLLVKCIDELRAIAPVDVVLVPGNHDHQKVFYLGDTLESWYRNCAEVNINNVPKTRKYYKYGKVLIGYTHGEKEKHIDLPIIMATENPKDWSETSIREWHLGHLHKNMVNEMSGVVVRTIPSLCGTDAYHYENGYVGNLKAAHGYLWDKEKGLTALYQFNL